MYANGAPLSTQNSPGSHILAPVLIANPPTSQIEFDFEEDSSAYGDDVDFDPQCDQASPGVSVLNVDQCAGDPR